MLFLISRTETTFSIICKALKLSRGNLSTHLKKLEEASLVSIEKKFVDTKPTTIISLSLEGRNQVLDYANNLSTILKARLNN